MDPNLINPIFEKPIQRLPAAGTDICADSALETVFRDTPIRDIPDADLGPVQQGVTAVRDSLAPIQGKVAGEAIRAADWNALVSAVRDLASNVLALTQLVALARAIITPRSRRRSPRCRAISASFTEAFPRSLLEFRRELEAAHFRNVVTGVLDAAEAPQKTRDDLLGRVDNLTGSLSADPSIFTAQLSKTGSAVLSRVTDADHCQSRLQSNLVVAKTQETAQTCVMGGVATTATKELGIYTRTTASADGGKFGSLLLRR